MRGSLEGDDRPHEAQNASGCAKKETRKGSVS